MEPFDPPGEVEVVYEDDDIVLCNKPVGLLVHRTPLDKGEKYFLLQILRDQIGKKLYPVNRLDKATSGLVLFTKHSELVRDYQERWHSEQCLKFYRLLCRGWLKEEVLLNHPIEEFKKEKERTHESQGEKKKATSFFKPLTYFEKEVNFGRFPMARYTLLEAQLLTGRRHQLRRHAAHLSHPIVGDSHYGDGKHNRFFRESLGLQGLFLQSYKMQLWIKSKNALSTFEIPKPPLFVQAEACLDQRPIDFE